METQQKLVVRQEIFIHAKPSVIWEILSTEAGMKAWLGPQDYQPHVGGTINFDVKQPDGHWFMFGEVVAMEPERKLAFTWTEQTVGGDTWNAPTLVTITLEPRENGTHVTLTHSGFENLSPDIRDEAYKGYVHGWEIRHVLEGLKAQAEARHE